MKKAIALILSIFMLFCLSLTGCSAEELSEGDNTDMQIILQIGNPIMQVNGTEKEIDPGRGTVPVIINNRTLLPIRAVVEEIGGSAEWEESTQTAIFTYNCDVVKLTVNNTTAYLNDTSHTLDSAPTIINNRTMLPIRFIAESFKFSVNWNEAEQIVTITKTPQTSLPPENSSGESESGAAVIYFSATGNTKALAEKIAKVTKADIYEIVPAVPYTSEDLNYNNDSCRANAEQQDDNARPEIEPIQIELEDYDTILLGYPIWWGTLPKVIYTFAQTYDLSGKTIMPFCTSGGSSISVSVSALKELCPNSNVTEGLRATASANDSQITEWLTRNNFSWQDDNSSSNAEQSNTLNIQAGEISFTASLADNSSAEALKELLSQGPLTIEMHDYGNFEKVGPIGTDLPRNDEQITTEPGDLILYQGNSFVIYYDTNSWNFTRLGKINNATQEELKEALGSGNVTVTLSLQ